MAPPAPKWGAGGAFRFSVGESTVRIRRARPFQAVSGRFRERRRPREPECGHAGVRGRRKGPVVVR
jgi:hypothetical protein